MPTASTGTARTAPRAEDEELVTAAAAGDEAALRLLHDQYKHQVFRIVHRQLGGGQRNHHLAEECAQEVWIKAWRALPQYKTLGGGFAPWLCTIANRAGADARQKKMRRAALETTHADEGWIGFDHPDPGPTVEDLLDRAALRQQLAEAIDDLTPRYRDVINLRFTCELSVEAAAGELGISPNAMKQLQHRAIRKLAHTLDMR